MDVKKIVNTLHPLERLVLPYVSSCSGLDDVIKASKLKEIEVSRALQWLQNKKIVVIDESIEEFVDLDVNGKRYLKEGLPERRLLDYLSHKTPSLSEIRDKVNLSKEELNICIGTLKKKAAIFIAKEKELMIKLTDNGKKLLAKEMLEEKFIKKEFPLPTKNIFEEDKFAFDELQKRKGIIKTYLVKTKKIQLTDIGKQILEHGIDVGNIIDRVSSDILKKGDWKKKEFRRFDIHINVPKIYGGKRHIVNQATAYIKKIWLDLGFKEMTGSLVQSSFWDLDALFVPQDHPARDMQDTFYIKDPKDARLPKELLARIKEVHENGGKTGSTGWQYPWSEEIAKENILRTHTTVLSARYISRLKEKDLPAKFFSVQKVFRNETLSWKSLFEFTQVEGIVVDPNANLKHLKGYLREFFYKMGYPNVRIRPGHFPYTEPSAEVDVWHPQKKKWVELGGAGIFRPEVTATLLGTEIPVLAWGLGMERIIMEYYALEDVRDLYKNDIRQLRDMKIWLK
jgi:phenylalanyl-tRNA synthetase alpha chain